MPACGSRSSRRGWRLTQRIDGRPAPLPPRQWIAHIQKVELAKVPVVRVERGHPVFAQQRGQVNFGHKVGPGRHFVAELSIVAPEVFAFGQRTHTRQPKHGLNVAGSHGMRQRLGKDARVGGHAQVAHHRGPTQAHQFRAGQSAVQKDLGAGALLAAGVMRVEQQIHVDGKAQGGGSSSAPSRASQSLRSSFAPMFCTTQRPAVGFLQALQLGQDEIIDIDRGAHDV